MVDERRGEGRFQPQARRAPVAAPPIAPALIANFLEIGVYKAETGSVVHVT